jgi:hypothetical protein
MEKMVIHTFLVSIIWGFWPKIHTFSLLTYVGAFQGPFSTSTVREALGMKAGLKKDTADIARAWSKSRSAAELLAAGAVVVKFTKMFKSIVATMLK